MIRLNMTTENTNLPSAESPHNQILALPSLVRWWSAELQDVTVASGAVTQFADKLSGNSNYAMAQASTDRQAAFTLAALGDESGAEFDATVPADVYAPTTPPTITGSMSVVAFYKPTALDALQGLFGNYTSGTERFGIWLRDTTPFGIGYCGSGVVGFPELAVAGTIQCTILGKTATSMRVRHRGTTSSAVAHTDGVGVDPVTLGAGSASGASPFDGVIGDVMVFDEDILDNADTLALLTEFAAVAYPGVTV